ncbi:unnamed protein product, partial [Adineta ricciae]
MLRQKNQSVKKPNDPSFHSIPVKLTTTLRNDQFLRCDTGLREDRILICASDEQADILQDAEELLVDGTFQIVPEISYPLYIIHGVFRDHGIPLVFVLLRQKTAETSKRLIDETAIVAPRWFPRPIMLDFEQSSIRSFKAAFSTILLFGCYFHLRQSIRRKLQVGRLRSNRTQRNPLSPISLWDVHTRTSQSTMRTNNSAEAYHRRIDAVFDCTHPTLWIFFEKLIRVEKNIRADIPQVCAGQQSKKRKLNERLERRSLNLLSNHHQDTS